MYIKKQVKLHHSHGKQSCFSKIYLRAEPGLKQSYRRPLFNFFSFLDSSHRNRERIGLGKYHWEGGQINFFLLHHCQKLNPPHSEPATVVYLAHFYPGFCGYNHLHVQIKHNIIKTKQKQSSDKNRYFSDRSSNSS